ncbi:hypothetical protein PPACK8108_LOCUS14210 [Phakopsora pachyrhizi]|uniref:Uncharacterized protein n=1 Tax=Phakopsora pachyrhizi TaxID=170000 RepID=A0AAV0B7V4_PHAPC|nr:hypothetical protein PPACK8108_LOCUS14210 [Phakopsora pachyrhizi]
MRKLRVVGLIIEKEPIGAAKKSWRIVMSTFGMGKVKEELQALQERRQTLGSTHNKTAQYLEEDYETRLARRIKPLE